MGSLLIATGCLMYCWISCAYYAVLKRQPSEKVATASVHPQILLRAILWPTQSFQAPFSENLENQEV